MTAPSYLPPMTDNPPDYLTEVAAEWHEAVQMGAPQYGECLHAPYTAETTACRSRRSSAARAPRA